MSLTLQMFTNRRGKDLQDHHPNVFKSSAAAEKGKEKPTMKRKRICF